MEKKTKKSADEPNVDISRIGCKLTRIYRHSKQKATFAS
uniref:Uncharacterized protein n=1 Tax=Rhizophora mucronata TaxID=61149 RepID=A0A2P2IMW3_RHIMU